MFCKLKIKGPINTFFSPTYFVALYNIKSLIAAGVFFSSNAGRHNPAILTFAGKKATSCTAPPGSLLFYELIFLLCMTTLSLDNMPPLVCCWASRLPWALEEHLNKGRSCACVYLFLPFGQTLEDLQNTRSLNSLRSTRNFRQLVIQNSTSNVPKLLFWPPLTIIWFTSSKLYCLKSALIFWLIYRRLSGQVFIWLCISITDHVA